MQNLVAPPAPLLFRRGTPTCDDSTASVGLKKLNHGAPKKLDVGMSWLASLFIGRLECGQWRYAGDNVVCIVMAFGFD